MARAASAVVAAGLLAALAPGAANAADPVGCGYADPGSGRYASTICWLDMSAYNDTQARTPGGQPMTVTLPGGYTVSFTVRASTPAGRTARGLAAVPFPAFGGSRIGNTFYTGVPGRPALYQSGGTRALPIDPDGGWTDVSLTNITVRDSTGASVSGYAFAIAEVEATANQENLAWTSDRPISLMESVGGPQTGNAGCEVNLRGLGTTRVWCNTPPIGGATSGGNTNLIMRADSPTTVTESMDATLSGNRNAEAFGIVTSKLQLTKQVAGRVRPSDSFDLSVRSPEGSLVGDATTGGANTATTGELTVLPRTTGAAYTLAEAVTAGSGTLLSDYAQSWQCTNNGAAVPAGGGASVALSPQPGDFVRCVVTNTQQPANLSIVKTATSRPAFPGKTLTYKLVVRNAGPSRASRVVVSDPLPSALSFVTASTGCTAAGQAVSCAIDSLEAGAEQTFEVTARVSDDALGTIANEATVTSDTPDSDPSDNRSREEVPVEPLADLSIVKRALSGRPVPGQNLTYELTVYNDGPSIARDVVVSDPLPRGLSFVSASRGCAFANGAVTCAVGELAAGRSVTLRVVTRVASSLTGRVVNTATVTSSTRDPDESNNRDREEVPSGPEADLSIVKVASVDRVGVGGQLFYTLLVRNDGPSDAQDVVVTDDADTGLTLLSARGSQGACTVAPSRASCSLGTIAAGGSAQVLVSAQVDRAGELVNRAKVDSPTKDRDLRNNRDERRVTGDPPPPAPPADLAIVKTSNRRAIRGSGTITYTLTVRNNGPGIATGVRVTDTPSLPIKVRSVRSSSGRCSATVPVRCDLGTLAAGAGATITIVAQPLAPGTLRNSATVTGEVPDPNPGNNLDGTSTKVQGLLKIKKVASAKTVRAGGTLTYKITVTNASAFALRSVRVCDALPSGLTFVSASPKAALSGGKRCWTIATLGAKKGKAFTIKARVLPGASGRKVNVATATAPNARGARSRAATGTAAIKVLAGRLRGGGVTG